MRARILKPGFFLNEQLARLPVRARLLFAGLWCLADRAGRLERRPKRIKAAIFPYERVRIEPLLTSLEVAGFVKSYHDGYTPCLELPSFCTHQHPHPHEPASKLPPCNDMSVTRPSVPKIQDGTDQDLTAAREIPFRVYAAIAMKAIAEAPANDLGEQAEAFKKKCAAQGLPYDAAVTTKALSASTAARARKGDR